MIHISSQDSMRKISVPNPDNSTSLLEITPLGAGSEVGRSCIVLSYKNKKVMFDCGIHPALKGIYQLPFFDVINPHEIDLILISHFHIDHCGALPHFMEHTEFRGSVYMTNPTKAIIMLLLQDFLKVNKNDGDEEKIEDLFDQNDLMAMENKVCGMDYHQENVVDGIKFWCYNAGHVIGAAMFMVEIAGTRVLYTGDYSSQKDRHLMGAEIPQISPHLLIVESTYGIHVHETREQRELRFKKMVKDIVIKGGKCLIPVFALGRAQELLLILDEFWENCPQLFGNIPIYHASTLADKCMDIYKTYVNVMNENIKNEIDESNRNPFDFNHIKRLNSVKEIANRKGPCVCLASPGMLQSGISRKVFEAWCSDSKNGVIITGYCVEGTLARDIQSEPSHIVLSTGERVEMNISVKTISFSAHSDKAQTERFIKKISPEYIVLVHGSSKNAEKLKESLTATFMTKNKVVKEIFTPGDTDRVKIEFKRETVGKVLGELAKNKKDNNNEISGIVLSKDYQTHLVSPNELKKYFNIPLTGVVQKLVIPYNENDIWSSSGKEFIQNWEDIVKGFNFPYQSLSSIGNTVIFTIFESITLVVDRNKRGQITISWNSTKTSDVLVNSLCIKLLSSKKDNFMIYSELTIQSKLEKILKVLQQYYQNVIIDGDVILINGSIKIDDNGNITDCKDTVLLQQLSKIIKRIFLCWKVY